MSQTDLQAIEAEIVATRARLADTVDELSVRLRPQEIGRRSLAGLSARARRATTTDQGRPRVAPVAAVAATAAAAGLLAWRRRGRDAHGRSERGWPGNGQQRGRLGLGWRVPRRRG
jgi:hypothetical protein